MKETTGKTKCRRTQELHLRLTVDEKKRIAEDAKEHGLSISDYVRVTVTRSQPVMPKAKPDRALFITTLGQLGKVGSLANQIAHSLHRERIAGNGHHVPDRIIQEALSGVKALSDKLLSILNSGA